MTAWFYYEVPLYAMFLNLLILPFSSWLLEEAYSCIDLCMDAGNRRLDTGDMSCDFKSV